MPDESPEKLEWNEENFAKVTSDLYKEVETNHTLRGQLMANPFAALSSRIAVPESYRGGVFAREKGQQTLMLYVPAPGASRVALPEGTSDAQSAPDYEILCTVGTLW